MEQRGTPRFQLHLPVSIVRCGAESLTWPAVTTNISSSGVLLVSEIAPHIGTTIEFVITLNHDGSRAVDMRCLGTVLRVERTTDPQQLTYSIAATIRRHEFPAVQAASASVA